MVEGQPPWDQDPWEAAPVLKGEAEKTTGPEQAGAVSEMIPDLSLGGVGWEWATYL